MGERQWTAAQKAAIEEECGSLLVDAAAGSGKTAVLVERAVRLMTRQENAIAADRILILTFTNAAAEELRIRLATRLDSALEEQGDSLFLQKQKQLLQRAFIGTLDAFCQQFAREWFAQLGIAPDVTVGQEAALDELSNTALENALEAAYENEAFKQFAALYGRSRSDEQASEAIVNLYKYVNTLPWPMQQLERFAAMYENDAPFSKTLWGKELFSYAEKAVSAAQALAQAAVQVAKEDGGLDAYLPMLCEEQESLTRLQALIRVQDWNGCECFLRMEKYGRLAQVRNYVGNGKEKIKFLRTKAKDIIGELKNACFVCSEEEYREDMLKIAPMVDALCKATAHYAQLYREKKDENKILDFSDFEHLTLSLLMNSEGVRLPAAKEMSSRYDFVMVDEYQDTNELQSALYSCLGNEEASNLFYVGDVKQSIYRFRRANPGIFLEKKNSWADYDSGQRPAVLRLGNNFRSGPGVVQAVNFMFQELMSESLGEVDYGQAERLIQSGNSSIRDGFSMVMLQKEENSSEAAYVADTIARMIKEQVLVHDGEFQRPCQYGDFCILLRTRSAMEAFDRALQAAKIPVNSDKSRELLSTPEVLPLQAVLAAIDNPGDDVALAATMLGPLFRFTPDDLAVLRAERKQGSLYGALLADEKEKSKLFVETLAGFRALATEMDLGRLCEEVALRTGYLSVVAAMEDGETRRGNVQCFLNWAAAMGRTRNGGLHSFVRLLQHGRGPQNAGYQNRGDKVSLLTAHKSKGLEFPIVIFADTAHRFNLSERTERILFHTELGIGFHLRVHQTLYPTLPFLAIKRRSIQENLSEEMRVLYVVLTRARDRLLCVYSHDDPSKKIAALAPLAFLETGRSYLLGRQTCFGDWMISALLRHAQAAPLWQCAQLPCCKSRPEQEQNPCPLHLSVESAKEPTADNETPIEPKMADANEVAKLQAGFAAVLPRSSLQDIPRKIAVSALSKEKNLSQRKRPALLYENGLTAAERGTAMHRFMQLANWNRAEQDVEAEIQKLVQANSLSTIQAAALKRKDLLVFFASPLFKRIQAAEKVLREYDFITALPAKTLNPRLPIAMEKEVVYLQGIADVVLIFEKSIEIIDYKTDKGKGAMQLCKQYQSQLNLYAKAIQKRFALPVQRLTIWSFSLGEEVSVPFMEKSDAAF